MRLHPRTLMVFITPAVLIGLWWGYVTLFKVPPFILPPPQVVGSELVRLFAGGTIWPHLGHTLGIILAGFVLGAAGGLLLGIVLARLPDLERMIAPYLLLIAILLVRPYGLFGETRIERV